MFKFGFSNGSYIYDLNKICFHEKATALSFLLFNSLEAKKKNNNNLANSNLDKCILRHVS